MRKRITKYWWIVPVVLLFFWTCCYHSMTHLGEDELSWINHYHEEDSFVFVSNFGNRDTLTIAKITIMNTLNPYNPWGFNTGYEFEAYGIVDYKIRHQNSLLDGFLLVEKETGKKNLSGSFFLDKRFVDFELDKLSKCRKDRFEYDDCIIADSINSRLTIDGNSSRHVNSFIWSKSKGLVMYSYDTGEIFVLVENGTID